MARPGIILYFELRQQLSSLTYEEKGRLIDAMLEYGELGVVPEFTGTLAIAWDFVKIKLDYDCGRYDKTILKRKYANYCRKCKDNGEMPASFEEWRSNDATYQQ